MGNSVACEQTARERKNYTNEECLLVKALYPTTTAKDIAVRLGCKEYRVLNIVWKLGLRKGKIPTGIVAGQRFGRLTVVRFCDRKCTKRRWECQCQCGKVTFVYTSNLVRGLTTSCGCYRKDLMFTGHGKVSGALYSTIRKSAEDRELDFQVSVEFLDQLFESQGGKCNLTGLDLTLRWNNDHTATGSLDRIDSSLGYLPGNVQWVHKDINQMKHAIPQERFVHLCALVAKHHGA